jgi:pSer/pThr/pTyr-binding forkhead associated (FHA) protein
MTLPQAGAMLEALTEEAEAALHGARRVELMSFPFRVGRETSPTDKPANNDLYMVERKSGQSMHVSSEHFAIECVDGDFYLTDRGSACGTIVAGRRIGGNRKGGRTLLRDGDELTVGTSRSRYIYRFGILIARD